MTCANNNFSRTKKYSIFRNVKLSINSLSYETHSFVNTPLVSVCHKPCSKQETTQLN